MGALLLFGAVQVTMSPASCSPQRQAPSPPAAAAASGARRSRPLTATRAAAVQLAVPVLRGAGATAFLGESLTARVALSGAAILAGIAVTLRRR